MNYKRGTIYYVDFGNYNRGSEQGGIRPAVVISNDIGNKNGPTIIFAPITSKNKKKIPTHIPLDTYEFLDGNNIILMEQIATKDKKFVKEKLGELNDNDIFKLDYYIGISLQLLNFNNCKLKLLINNKVNQLKDLKGYINLHICKFNEIKTIQNDINEYNKLFVEFKQICENVNINYKYLYNDKLNINLY